jgi:hypothetical protein
VRFNDVVIPPRLGGILGASRVYNKCIDKNPGSLSLRLNSVTNLGFPAGIDFDLDFVGSLDQAEGVKPNDPYPIVRWDIDQFIRKDFDVGGEQLHIEYALGIVRAVIAHLDPLSGRDCHDQLRAYRSLVLTIGGVNEVSGSKSNTLALVVEYQGLQDIVLLNQMEIVGFSAGDPIPVVPHRLASYDALKTALLLRLWKNPGPTGSTPSVVVSESDRLVALAEAVLTRGETHDRPDMP